MQGDRTASAKSEAVEAGCTMGVPTACPGSSREGHRLEGEAGTREPGRDPAVVRLRSAERTGAVGVMVPSDGSVVSEMCVEGQPPRLRVRTGNAQRGRPKQVFPAVFASVLV